MKRSLRPVTWCLVTCGRNRDLRNQRRAITLHGLHDRALGVRNQLCSQLMEQLGDTVYAPGRLHQNHQIVRRRSRAD